MKYPLRFCVFGPALIGLCGCVSMVTPKLRDVSAGYTGCLPDENQITNVRLNLGVTTWNASCKGKTYLCSAVGNSPESTSQHCAPVTN
jgi:hypothetical protein